MKANLSFRFKNFLPKQNSKMPSKKYLTEKKNSPQERQSLKLKKQLVKRKLMRVKLNMNQAKKKPKKSSQRAKKKSKMQKIKSQIFLNTNGTYITEMITRAIQDLEKMPKELILLPLYSLYSSL